MTGKIKLTEAQSKALQKASGLWRDAYELGASIATLDALVKKGLLERRGGGGLGAMYSPRTTLEYRRAPDLTDTQEGG